MRFYLAIGATIVAIVVVWWLLMGRAEDAADRAATANAGRVVAEGRQQSGREAVGTVAAAGEREAASEALTRNNETEIRNAEGSDVPVARPASDAGLRSLCRRAAYADSPRCRELLQPRS